MQGKVRSVVGIVGNTLLAKKGWRQSAQETSAHMEVISASGKKILGESPTRQRFLLCREPIKHHHLVKNNFLSSRQTPNKRSVLLQQSRLHWRHQFQGLKRPTMQFLQEAPNILVPGSKLSCIEPRKVCGSFNEISSSLLFKSLFCEQWMKFL